MRAKLFKPPFLEHLPLYSIALELEPPSFRGVDDPVNIFKGDLYIRSSPFCHARAGELRVCFLPRQAAQAGPDPAPPKFHRPYPACTHQGRREGIVTIWVAGLAYQGHTSLREAA